MNKIVLDKLNKIKYKKLHIVPTKIFFFIFPVNLEVQKRIKSKIAQNKFINATIKLKTVINY